MGCNGTGEEALAPITDNGNCERAALMSKVAIAVLAGSPMPDRDQFEIAHIRGLRIISLGMSNPAQSRLEIVGKVAEFQQL
jgi:hypothetical protein